MSHRHTDTRSITEADPSRTGPWWWVSTIVTWLLVFAVSALVLALVVIPLVGNAQPYTVLTESMRPTYPPGTLVVVRDSDTNRLPVGEVITFQIRSGEPAVVTHRIIATGMDSTGGRTYTTQGDNNPQPDPGSAEPAQIRGAVWYSIPYLGHVNNWLTGDTRVLVVTVMAGALGLYAAVQLVGAVVDRRRVSTGSAPR
ncbi:MULTISPECIES: signal peptidase I [Gordonia]|uniref:signal peptidase I n=1 Tax=Gordonia TaxID=2053 RepID=UPI003396D048